MIGVENIFLSFERKMHQVIARVLRVLVLLPSFHFPWAFVREHISAALLLHIKSSDSRSMLSFFCLLISYSPPIQGHENELTSNPGP